MDASEQAADRAINDSLASLTAEVQALTAEISAIVFTRSPAPIAAPVKVKRVRVKTPPKPVPPTKAQRLRAMYASVSERIGMRTKAR